MPLGLDKTVSSLPCTFRGLPTYYSARSCVSGRDSPPEAIDLDVDGRPERTQCNPDLPPVLDATLT